VRIVIELRRGEERSGRHQQPVQEDGDAANFGIILLAIVDNQPRYLSLRAHAAAVPRSIAARCCCAARAST
jgi:DNA gyrase/topoisomerase IV subunit A